MESPVVSPVSRGERYRSLDVLRGFAILGILIMNITAFAMPFAVYTNPLAYGEFSGANQWVWALSHVFAEQKFLSLFSILFGAGVALMSERAAAKGVSPWRLHGRRMLWLALIGMIHAYFLWFGDILFTYAVAGLVAFLFRKRSVKTLVAAGLVIFTVPTLIFLLSHFSQPYWPEADRVELREQWHPREDVLADEVEGYRQGWWSQMEYRIPTAFYLQSLGLFLFSGWKALGLMLLGMALYRSRILTGEASSATYRRFVFAGFGLGFPIVLYGMGKHLEAGFDVTYSMFLGGLPNYWGSLFVALGYLAAICLVTRKSWFPALTDRLAAVGRMALTNYLMQTVLCTLIFYGHGLGYFGELDRLGQAFVVLGVWIFQLVISPIWLERYRFGPCEWLWRSLTYGRLQPMLRQDVAEQAAA